MIHVRVSTRVTRSFDDVKALFNSDLLEKLNPPFPPAKIVLYEGEQPGDRVWIELNFILFRQLWKSVITLHEQNPSRFMFRDVGVQLPFFLKSWSHTHLLESREAGITEITDDIRFEPAPWLPRFLARWMIAGLMYYRKPQYKKWLSTSNQN